MTRFYLLSLLSCIWFVTLSACSDSAQPGSLTVLLEAEDVIVNGLQAGDEVSNIRDGWSVTFDKYIVGVGDIEVHPYNNDQAIVRAPDLMVVDLTQVPKSGLELWQIEDLSPGSWHFNYVTTGALHGGIRHEASVEKADFDAMVKNDWTYLIEGTMSQPNGQSCPPKSLASPGDRLPNGETSGDGIEPNDCYDAASVDFRFEVPAETIFTLCNIDGLDGFSIASQANSNVAITIHGDHPFFNGFPEGDEGGVERLAQWLADSDLNLDGTVTIDELEKIAPADLPVIDDRYQLGGSPIEELNTMRDYLIGQLKTQGHFQGEGACTTDGKEHNHPH